MSVIFIKVHQHGMGAPGGTEDAGGPRGGDKHQGSCSGRSTWRAVNFLITTDSSLKCDQEIL